MAYPAVSRLRDMSLPDLIEALIAFRAAQDAESAVQA